MKDKPEGQIYEKTKYERSEDWAESLDGVSAG